MLNTREYSRQVRRSLLQRDLMLGIPTTGLVLIFILAVIFIYGLSMLFMIAPLAVLFITMRILTKMDPWLIDMTLENLGQKDRYIP